MVPSPALFRGRSLTVQPPEQRTDDDQPDRAGSNPARIEVQLVSDPPGEVGPEEEAVGAERDKDDGGQDLPDREQPEAPPGQRADEVAEGEQPDAELQQ